MAFTHPDFPAENEIQRVMRISAEQAEERRAAAAVIQPTPPFNPRLLQDLCFKQFQKSVLEGVELGAGYNGYCYAYLSEKSMRGYEFAQNPFCVVQLFMLFSIQYFKEELQLPPRWDRVRKNLYEEYVHKATESTQHPKADSRPELRPTRVHMSEYFSLVKRKLPNF